MSEARSDGVQSCDPTPAERSKYAGVLRHVIECLRSTGRFTDDEGETTNQLEDLLVILEARNADVTGAPDQTFPRSATDGDKQ